jgi:hypothetical protein
MSKITKTPVEQSSREALVEGLRELAQFLEDNPSVEFPDSLSCGANWGCPGDAESIRRVETWKAHGFEDDVIAPTPGHHRATMTFAGFKMTLSYVEDAASRPVAWGTTRGEPNEQFQQRVDEALAAVTQ